MSASVSRHIVTRTLEACLHKIDYFSSITLGVALPNILTEQARVAVVVRILVIDTSAGSNMYRHAHFFSRDRTWDDSTLMNPVRSFFCASFCIAGSIQRTRGAHRGKRCYEVLSNTGRRLKRNKWYIGSVLNERAGMTKGAERKRNAKETS